METQVKLEHKVSFTWLMRFALPTILSSIFSSLYSTVDGIFVARWVNTDALSAINITMPMIFLASALGMMFGSSGNALVARKLGEGKKREAQEDFSLLMVVAFIFSVTLAVLCFLFLNPLCYFLGSDKALLPYCRQYMIPVLISHPFAVFGMVFQLSFITVGKAGFGALLSVLGGVLNIVLDWLFNRILMELSGSDGVASLSIIWYAQGLFGGLFRGYINGNSSVVSYNLGRGDKEQLSKLFSISMWTLGITAVWVTVASYFVGDIVVGFFAKSNARVEEIALHGFRIVATSFFMMAYNVFASGWFTALNDGKTSAVLSFCRTIIFMVIPVLLLPKLWGMNGVWLSITTGEMLSIIMSIYYFVKYKGIWSVNLRSVRRKVKG